MAATFVNNVVYYEDGYGDVHVRFAVSDSYAGLFLPDSDSAVTLVGCVEIDSIKKGMQSGAQANDEVQFSISAAAAESAEDQDALAFILAAQDVATKRYVAVFIEPSETPTNTEIDFIGLVSAEQEATDIRWHGSLYSSGVTPVRNWKFVARPYQIEMFDGFEIESLVTNTTDGINATGSTWISTHVADRQAYFHDVRSGTTRDVRFKNLVSLNDVLSKLTTIVQGRMRTQLSEPTFSLTIEGATSPFSFTPTRFKVYYYSGTLARYVTGLKMLEHDQRVIKIGPAATEAESPWVHWGIFAPVEGAKELSSWNRCKTYTNLLYQIAYCFGFHLQFEYTSVTSLKIRFVPMDDFVKTDLYPADVKDAALKVSPIKGSSSSLARPRSASSMYSMEGSKPEDHYYLSQSAVFAFGSIVQSNLKQQQPSSTSSNALLFSVSPTVRTQGMGEDDGWQMYSSTMLAVDLGIAHNAVFYDNGAVKHQLDPDYYKDDVYRADFPIESHIHNGIYLKVTGASDGYFDYGVDGTDIWSPAGYAHIDDKSFDKLSDAVNWINGVAADSAYETKYTITVPYICRFSSSETSPHDEWRNLIIGGKMTIDGTEYAVTSFERSIRNRSTKLEIYAASKFSFAASTGLASTATTDLVLGAPIIGSVPAAPTGAYIFDTDVVAGDAVVRLATGHVTKMETSSLHYGSFFGCAVADTAAGDSGDVATAGQILQSSHYDFTTIGEAVYLRKTAAHEVNVKPKSQELRQPIGTEVLHLCVGQAISADTIKILPSEHWLFT